MNSTAGPAVSARHVFKVFGEHPQELARLIREGADREELNHLGTAAVIDASFDVAPGEVFVVMGLSGSGKSTLIRMVNGLLEPTSGSIELDGVDIAGLSGHQLRAVRREKVSMVFQHFALLPHRTVGQNAAYALEVQGLNRSDREHRARQALRMVGLDGWGGSMPGQLSGGMQQRVGLARALAAGTDVMLMDEAFSALDPLIRREMQDQLIELQKQLGKTILFITHDLNEAMRLGDRVAMMRDGGIVQIGTSRQILDEPATAYVAQFVRDVDRSRVLTAGSIMEPVTVAQQDGNTQVPMMGQADTVQSDTVPTDLPLAELMTQAAQSEGGLMVVDDTGALAGIITRTTLLNALAEPRYDDDAATSPGHDHAAAFGHDAAASPGHDHAVEPVITP